MTTEVTQPPRHLKAIEWEGDKVLNITWQTSDVCNYRCSYCNPGNYGGVQPNTAIKTYTDNLDRMISRMERDGYTKVKLFLSGGEPTHWTILGDVCDWFETRLPGRVTIGVNTNLSRPLSWWRKNHRMFDDVVASYHPEWVKHERFLENALYLQDRVNYLAVRIMMLEERWHDMMRASEEIWDKMDNVYLEHVPILDEMSRDTDPYSYSDPAKVAWLMSYGTRIKQNRAKPPNRIGSVSTKEIYDDGHTQPVNSNRLLAEKRNFFKGWQCDIGCSINIGIGGDITMASCGQSGVIGYINRPMRMGDMPSSIICGKDHCHCGTDICIPKRMLSDA